MTHGLASTSSKNKKDGARKSVQNLICSKKGFLDFEVSILPGYTKPRKTSLSNNLFFISIVLHLFDNKPQKVP